MRVHINVRSKSASPHTMYMHLSSHLTSALGAVVNGPLVFVLVHDAVVDADTAVNAKTGLNQLVLIRLRGRGRRNRQNRDIV